MSDLGYGLLVLVCALLLRMLATFLAVSGGGLTCKEKLFMVIAWLPKATAQLTLPPVKSPGKYDTPGSSWLYLPG